MRSQFSDHAYEVQEINLQLDLYHKQVQAQILFFETRFF